MYYNRRWETIMPTDAKKPIVYALMFDSFDGSVAEITKNKHEWRLSSELLGYYGDYYADATEDVEKVEKDVEDEFREYLEDQKGYYESLIKLFDEEV